MSGFLLSGTQKREMAWRCPNCQRIFRHHVFTYATPAAGPVCDTCCMELVWAEMKVPELGAETAPARWGAPFP